MELLLGVFGLAALVTCLVGAIWLLVIAFRTHVGWGLAFLFIPFAAIAFVVTHWSTARKPFLCLLGGMAIAAGVASLAPAVIGHMFSDMTSQAAKSK
ncbi:MAG: hypothetical protein C5B53_04745 [Candidatus Melainabacteria bacterium]|nr:MAG: hypothetical protein C5B53_04745 [Candidatus Melainabacteria bacterium]